MTFLGLFGGAGSDGSDGATCALVREALSARADGEDPGIAGTDLDDHLAACPACAAYAGELAGLVRSLRVRVATPAPDLSAAILAGLGQPGRQGRLTGLLDRGTGHLRHPSWSRATQWAVAVAPLGAALPTLALGVFAHPHVDPSHLVTPCTAELVRRLVHPHG